MKTFNDLKIGDKICFVTFDPTEELNFTYEAKVIELKKISSDIIKITCKHHENEIDEYSVLNCLASSDWYGDTMFFVSKEYAIYNIKRWVEEAKQNLYETNKLLVKVKELK